LRITSDRGEATIRVRLGRKVFDLGELKTGIADGVHNERLRTPHGLTVVYPCKLKKAMTLRYPTMLLVGAMVGTALVCAVSWHRRPAGALPLNNLPQVPEQLPRDAEQEIMPTQSEPMLGPYGE
jgi:hypothetical protein